VFFRAVLNGNRRISKAELRFENFPLHLLIWFYFQLFQNFFISFVVKKYLSRCSSEKFHLDLCQRFFIILPDGPHFSSV
jgi:hypothetical protein